MDPHTPLSTHLAPIQSFLMDPEVTEISINRPQEVFVERKGRYQCHRVGMSADHLRRLGDLIANFNEVPNDLALISGVLPDGSRVQVARPPVTPKGQTILSIRKHPVNRYRLDDLIQNRMFEIIGRDYADTLRAAVREKRNILVCGGTGTGKTTLLEALVREIPDHERLAVLEDTREIQISHPNHFSLTAVRERSLTLSDLLIATLRMRPDRIIIGEIRGIEAATFMEALATGHDGSISTLHASSIELAYAQLAQKIERAGFKQQERASLVSHLKSLIPIVVQLKHENGVRSISEIKIPI